MSQKGTWGLWGPSAILLSGASLAPGGRGAEPALGTGAGGCSGGRTSCRHKFPQTQGGLALLGRNRQPAWLGRAGWESLVSPWKGSGLDSEQSLEV